MPPVQERVESCKLFLERAKKRVQRAQEVIDRACEQKALYEAEVVEGEARLAKLEAEAANIPTSVPSREDPMIGGQMPDHGEMAEMRRELEKLRQFRDRFPAAAGNDALVSERKALRSAPSANLPGGAQRSWTASGLSPFPRYSAHSLFRYPGFCCFVKPAQFRVAESNRVWRSRTRGKDWWVGWARRIFVVFNGTQSPRRRAITVSTRRRTVRTILRSLLSGARYGLRGVRVGEASHPGLPKQGSPCVDRVPEEVLDGLEAALTRIDSSGADDDEPLVRPSSGRNVVPRRSTTEGPQEGVAFAFPV